MKKKDDKDSIQNIFLGLRSSLARAVMGLVPPREVEDIVQETYVRVCQIKRPQDIRQPRSYLFRTARNLALDYLKRSDTKLTDGMDEQDMDSLIDHSKGDDSTFEQVASNEEFALFCEAVRHLPVKCRRVFVMKKVYGYSQIEIARKLKISIGTVEKHISQGIKRSTYFMQQHHNSQNNSQDHGEKSRGSQQPNRAPISLADRAPKGPRS